MRVLFIEDDVDVSEMYGAQLRIEDHEVTIVPTAQEAIDMLDRAGFDVIVLDILLPGSNGIAVLHELQGYEDWCEVPVVVLSNVTTDDLAVDPAHLQKLGVRNYLIKMETTPQDLATAVRAVMA